MQHDFRLGERAIDVGGQAVFESEWRELAKALGVRVTALSRYPEASLLQIWRRVGGPSLEIARAVDARVVGALMPRVYSWQEAPARGVWVDKETGEPYGAMHVVGRMSGYRDRVTTIRLASALVDEEGRDAMLAAHVIMDSRDGGIGWLAPQLRRLAVQGGRFTARPPDHDRCRCDECASSRWFSGMRDSWTHFVHDARALLRQWELVSWLPGQNLTSWGDVRRTPQPQPSPIYPAHA